MTQTQKFEKNVGSRTGIASMSKLKSYRRMIRMLVAVAAIMCLVAGAAAAQASVAGAPSGSNILYAELAKVPTKAAIRPNPLEHDRDALAAGGKLYGMHCAECHGATGEGGTASKKGPSLRAPEVQQSSPGALFWLLTNGVVRRGMPVWSKLPEPQRWQLVSYVKSLTAPGTTGPSAAAAPPH